MEYSKEDLMEAKKQMKWLSLFDTDLLLLPKVLA